MKVDTNRSPTPNTHDHPKGHTDPNPQRKEQCRRLHFSHANGLYLPRNREDRQQLGPEVPTLTTEQVERLLFGKNDSTQAGPIAQDPSTRE
jgi:hypothetical protein